MVKTIGNHGTDGRATSVLRRLFADECGAAMAENAVTLALLTAGTAGVITTMMDSIAAYMDALGEIFEGLG